LLKGGATQLECEDQHGGQSRHREEGDGAAPAVAAAGGGTLAGLQEVMLGAGEGRVARRVL